MLEKVLEVNNLSKSFGKTKAVKNISFHINEGEIVGLLGPNGAGKTTTIQMLLGTLTPTSGDAWYFGKNFKDHREEILQKVNFCSSYIRLPWRLTVYENLDVIARLYGVKNRKRRIKKLLDAFDISEFEKRPFASLSAGQIMRVVLAKSFINYPKVILLDEPTASLDPDIAKKVRDFLIREQKEFQVSMLYTSHNMAEVERLCDRVIFLNKGKILAEDTPLGLANKIDISRVDLLINRDITKAQGICVENKWKANISDNFLKVELKEKDISKLLSTLAKSGIDYSEISIDKPTLEDFFLQVSSKGKLPQKEK
ncbi:hypothetical protein A3H19_04710 [Candidatus Woesebacteria bacterium RIFCSPLOWO2_12_FULL_39_9]|nr:MAG: hypothetical protein A3H19_04710 [Candidatus Woesebacteria bacterium RIFCSPLOWO2_12_FULL_39_9]